MAYNNPTCTSTVNGTSSMADDTCLTSTSTPPSSSSPRTQQDQGRREKLKQLMRPVFQESYFTAEYCLLATIQKNQPSKLSGVYAIPSAQSAFLWFGVLFIHSGPWMGGIFRFTIKFPDTFPDANSQNNIPTVQFTGAYPKCHPWINPTNGIFDIRRLQKAYNRSSHHIWQLLKCVRKIFYKLDILEGIPYPNKTAADLCLYETEQFRAKCDLDVQNGKAKVYEEDHLYSNDTNYIRFTRDYGKIEIPQIESGIGLSFMK